MQAHSLFMGGIPLLFYVDEIGYTNDYSYLSDVTKDYDNRWMHRPMIDWKKNEKRKIKSSVENIIFNSTRKLISIRRSVKLFSDYSNINWMKSYNPKIAGYSRYMNEEIIFCLYNFSSSKAILPGWALKEFGINEKVEYSDLWTEEKYMFENDIGSLKISPYQFLVLKN